MTSIARALAEALGLAPAPWPEGQVRAVLRKWIELRVSRRTGEPGLDKANINEEPGWLLLISTVSVKVARCPANVIADLGTRMPAVELVVLAEFEIDTMRAEWEHEAMRAARCGCAVDKAEAARRDRERRQALELIARVRDTQAYRRGIEYLGREFAWCARMDAGFRAWVRKEER